MSDQIEQLTEEERARVELVGTNRERRYARIIDAHAADRAALVARVQELDYANEQRRLVIGALESKLAAANALLGRIPDCLLTDCPVYADLSEYKRAHLSAQPLSDNLGQALVQVIDRETAQAAIDQEHRLACE